MAYSDEDLLPISALQHLAFCERQCALIHIERTWEENQLTAEGRIVHERVDEGYKSYRKGLRQFSGVYVRSLEHGLYGRLDVVELTKVAEGGSNCDFLSLSGQWTIAPVEFKRGRPKRHDADRVQLCAQALCLEEMTQTEIPSGAFFYAAVRRRVEVAFDDTLRTRTRHLIARHREIVETNVLPPPVKKKHCSSCSLQAICQPGAAGPRRTKDYFEELFS